MPAVVGALDCTSGHALPATATDVVAVTGRLLVRVLRRPPTDRPAVVVGDATGGTGRTMNTRAAVYTAEGDLCAAADVTWVRLEPASH